MENTTDFNLNSAAASAPNKKLSLSLEALRPGTDFPLATCGSLGGNIQAVEQKTNTCFIQSTTYMDLWCFKPVTIVILKLTSSR